ncbi:MAG TPA: TonB-dependent receptor [Candidatus Ozemobacteraceae bacterium]|nr:TonB-dependent receptor [Candidatus Ozemobacteraceae bacterium]
MTFAVSLPLTNGRIPRRALGCSIRVLWCVAALWSCGCCHSASGEEQPIKLEKIVVEATRLAGSMGFTWLPTRPVGETPHFSLHEILNEIPGIHLVRRGGGFAETQDEAVVVRGFDARRYVLTLNDHPMNMAGVMGGSRIDWDILPPDMARSLLFERTPHGAAPHGSVAGLMRVETSCPVKTEGGIRWEAGPFDLERREFSWGDRSGGLAWRIDTADSRSDGFLRNQNRELKRVAGRMFWNDPAGRDELELGLTRLEEIRGYAVANRPGLPGYDPSKPDSDGERIMPGDTVASDGTRLSRNLSFLDMTWRHHVADGAWSLGHSRSEENRRDLAKNAAGRIIYDRSIDSDDSSYWFLSREAVSSSGRWKLGADRRYLRYGDGEYAVAPPAAMPLFASQKIDMDGFFGEWSRQMSGGELSLDLRHQKYSADRDDARAATMRPMKRRSTIPGIAWSWKPSEGNRHRVSVRKLWRAPSMAEYYWWSANYANPARIGSGRELEPESGLGVSWDSEWALDKRTSLETGVFVNDLNDYIHFVHVFPFSSYNVDRVRVRGLEWHWRRQITETTELQIGHTWQETKRRGVVAADKRNGLADELDYRPRHVWNLKTAHHGRWWDAMYTIRYITSQRVAVSPTPMRQDIVTLSPFAVQDLEIGLRWTKSTRLAVRIDNLGDREYAEQAGYPMPGRTVSFSVEQSFD